MRTTKSGLILPEGPQNVKQTIDDFDLMDPMEMQKMLVEPIEQALKQGISPEQPTTIPIGGLCSLVKTVRQMSAALVEIQELGHEMLNDETIDKGYKSKVRKILGLPAPIDVSDLFGQMSAGEEDGQK